MVAEMESEKFGERKVETLIDTRPYTLSHVVAKTIADTLTCVEFKAPVKTEGISVADVEAYIDINTLNEFEAKALVYTQAYKFLKVQTKSVTDTLTRY